MATFFMKENESRMRCQHAAAIMFQGGMPFATPFVMNRPSNTWAGAYYTLAPKVGSVCTGGNIEPNLDFPVNPEWVFSLVEAQKMLYKDARGELARCAKACERR